MVKFKLFAALLSASFLSAQCFADEVEHNSKYTSLRSKRLQIAAGTNLFGLYAKVAVPVFEDAFIETNAEASIFQGNSGIVYLKYFWSETFYTLSGLGYIGIAKFGDDPIAGYGPSAGIGNQWDFPSGFLLGCDWIGLTPLLIPDHGVSRDHVGKVYGFALRFYIGFGF